MLEKKYPIYRFSATWNQSDYKNNGTSCRQMYKEKLSDEEMNEKLEEFKTNVTKDKEEVEFISSTVEYIEDETWVGKCFCHFTFNQFDNDSEAEKSFEEFVDRKISLNLQHGHHRDDMNFASKEPYYCLMGAEDRWRWEVCHCEHCEKNEWTIINH